MRAAWIVALCAAFASGLARAQQAGKYALVLSNSAYTNSPLANPPRDAALISEKLQRLNFTVTRSDNLTRAGFYQAIRQFADALPSGAMAVVYYAGHGMQIEQANYLVPVDFEPTSPEGVRMRAFPLTALLEKLAASKAGVNIVVVDACRNDPFLPSAAIKYRSFEGLGLAATSPGRGTLVAYSTAPGQLVQDGPTDTNSLYAATLADTISEPGLPVEQVFKRVGNLIRKKTYDDQAPWFESSLTGDVYFFPPDQRRLIPIPNRAQEPEVTEAPAPLPAAGPWYSSLGNDEWTKLDAEIQTRVIHATRDELPELLHKAKAGNVVAQTTVGLLYRDGVDKIVDERTGRTLRLNANNSSSLKWLTTAANAGFPVALAELGEMYALGKGVDRNTKKSRSFLEKAAKSGYPRAQLDLAQLKLESSTDPNEIRDTFLNLLKRQGTVNDH